MRRASRSTRLGFVFLGISAFLLAITVHSERRQQAAGSLQSQTTHIVLLGTTDLHGRIDPLDYWTNKPAKVGLGKIATLVRQVRAEQTDVLLLDSGDIIEGTPMIAYFNTKELSKPNPMIAAMNALHYDAAEVGNHEFNFGLGVLLKAKLEAHFPMLAANIRSACRKCENYFAPYVVKQVGGVRVAIVGFVTPVIPSWEPAKHYKGYTFEPIVETARRVIPEARRNADVVVVIAHSGLGADPEAGIAEDPHDIPGENTTIQLAERVPGIDVILFGHTHEEVAGRTIHGVLLVQAKNSGESLARVDLDLTRGARGNWEVMQKRSNVLHVMDQTPADPELTRLAQPYERATQAYLDKPVATATQQLDGVYGRYQDDPLVDLIHKMQLAYGHADVSFATIFLTSLKIPPGPVTVRQIAALYLYDNTLYTVEMTGAQIREALEHAASFYGGWPVPAGAKMKLPDYYADSAEGVSYTIDLTRPVGDRIVDLRYRGAAINPTQKFRVAINNYRALGGGKYDFQKVPVLSRSSQTIQDMLIEYVTRTRTLPTTTDNNWHIVPEEAVEEMIQLTQAPAAGPAGATKPSASIWPMPEIVAGALKIPPSFSWNILTGRSAESRESY